jgi:putative endonuclease
MTSRAVVRSMKDLGKRGEDLAVALCKAKGFMVIEQNFRTPFGEIDIIAKDGNVFVFIEVKARTGDAYGAPFEAVTRGKRDRITKVAMSYMKRFRKEVPARFDVISISMTSEKPDLEYIQDAFEI